MQTEIEANPALFHDAATFRVADIWPKLLANFENCIVATKDFPEVPPKYYEGADDLPLHPALRFQLYSKILPPKATLYAHQGEAIKAILANKDVIIETPTASGKTMCYALPLLDACLRNPKTTALYLSPINALSENQLEVFSRFDESGTDWAYEEKQNPLYRYIRAVKIGGQVITVARYDGLIKDPEHKKLIRQKKPNILITNPEMLHWGILSWAKPGYWAYLFQQLRYVVLDEMHTYKGIFGSSFANVLRRLRRLCAYEGQEPHFIGCSATIKNPLELFEKLTGHSGQLIDASQGGAGTRKRRFVIMSGQRQNEGLISTTRRLLGTLMGEGRVKTITFVRSIPGVDAVYRHLCAELKRYQLPSTIVSHFKRELTPELKADITAGLRSGKLHGVISTTALQMGIDIGDLSACVIAKYPGSIASVWQQAGRAGRSGEGLIFLLLDDDPLNQYFADHPQEFFAMESEEIFIDPDNPYVMQDQLWCAAKDRPLHAIRDQAFFGKFLPDYLKHMVARGRLFHDTARKLYVLADPEVFPAKEVPIRAVGFEFPIVDTREIRILNPDASRAARYFHKQARFQVEEELYEIIEFQLDYQKREGKAMARKLPNPDHITEAACDFTSSILRARKEQSFLGLPLCYGDVSLCTEVHGYYQIPLDPRQFKGSPPYRALNDDAPPVYEYETCAVWLQLPEELYKKYDVVDLRSGLRALQKAMTLSLCIEECCDPADVAGMEASKHPDTMRPTLFLYDTVPGGIGITEKGFASFGKVFQRAYKILKECPFCSIHPDSRGCPRCVTEQHTAKFAIDRKIGIEIAEYLNIPIDNSVAET